MDGFMDRWSAGPDAGWGWVGTLRRGQRVGCSVAAVVVAVAVPRIPTHERSEEGDRASTTHPPTRFWLLAAGSPSTGASEPNPGNPCLPPTFNTLSIVYCSSPRVARFQIQRPERGGRGATVAMSMKQPRGRQEPRRMGNAAMVVTMLVSLCVLTYIKARYCSNPFPKAAEELEVDEDYDSTRYKLSGPIGEEDFDPSRPTCYNTSKRSERCAAVGDIRVDGNHSKIYINPLSREWKTKPYARLHDPVAMDDVREFTLVPFGGSNHTTVPPLCTRNHSVPGFLFSSGGFAGNLYHDYADVLVPLFASTHHFGGEVQFLLADIKDWWADKFKPLFRQLSRYDVIDVNNDQEVHCFPRIVIGSTFHRAMGIDASRTPGGETVADFKRLLRRAFRLERAVASRSGAPRRKDRPRLLIISRKSSRRFVNERAMALAAAAAKFDVRIAEPDNHTDMPNFARLVNSADVMMGVHGAGLTNMVFLPSRAVLVQVVPFGGLEWLTRVTFKDPARDMDVTYMEYNVSLEESSLRDLYPKDHFYLKHPYDVHKKGWDAIKTVYLDKQNVRLNLTRFTRTLEQARDLLPSP